MQFPDRGRKHIYNFLQPLKPLLRNVVPRQGTETGRKLCYLIHQPPIEKCSSPTGDGNSFNLLIFLFFHNSLRNVVPRQGTETRTRISFHRLSRLRNVVPRQGTETCYPPDFIQIYKQIEKCSSPTGDGNLAAAFVANFDILLRNVVPRQGTETAQCLSSAKMDFKLRNVVPRQGTETLCHPSTITACGIEKCSSPTGDGNIQKSFYNRYVFRY